MVCKCAPFSEPVGSVAVAGPRTATAITPKRKTNNMKKRKSNIALYLYRLKVEAVLALMRNVGAKMKGNPNFPDPVVKIMDFLLKADALEKAMEAATFGSRQSKLLRDQLLAECLVMLDALASYVRGVCNGDPVKLESSGFQLAKEPQVLPLFAPTGLKVVRTAIAGMMKLSWKKEKGVVLYYLEQQEEGSSTWTRILSTTRVRHTITGLTTGKEYSYRVQAVSSQGISPMSEVVSQKAA